MDLAIIPAIWPYYLEGTLKTNFKQLHFLDQIEVTTRRLRKCQNKHAGYDSTLSYLKRH